ncbi:MAG: hypothetical protein GX051_09010 [Clostridiales bacterium]|nr:hypothetical protein [Clostridiales bacterium]
MTDSGAFAPYGCRRDALRASESGYNNLTATAWKPSVKQSFTQKSEIFAV